MPIALTLSMASVLLAPIPGAGLRFPGPCSIEHWDTRSDQATLVERFEYGPNRKISRREAHKWTGEHVITDYVYDSSELLVQENDSDGAWTEHIRDTDGAVLSLSSGDRVLHGHFATMLRVDQKPGLVKGERDLDGDGVIDEIVLYEYAAGRLVEKTVWEDNALLRDEVYIHDAKGRLLRTEIWMAEPERVQVWRHEYDSAGNLLERSTENKSSVYDYSCWSR